MLSDKVSRLPDVIPSVFQSMGDAAHLYCAADPVGGPLKIRHAFWFKMICEISLTVGLRISQIILSIQVYNDSM